MKWLTIGVLLNFFFAAPVLSELTKEDLQAIRHYCQRRNRGI